MFQNGLPTPLGECTNSGYCKPTMTPSGQLPWASLCKRGSPAHGHSERYIQGEDVGSLCGVRAMPAMAACTHPLPRNVTCQCSGDRDGVLTTHMAPSQSEWAFIRKSRRTHTEERCAAGSTRFLRKEGHSISCQRDRELGGGGGRAAAGGQHPLGSTTQPLRSAHRRDTRNTPEHTPLRYM